MLDPPVLNTATGTFTISVKTDILIDFNFKILAVADGGASFLTNELQISIVCGSETVSVTKLGSQFVFPLKEVSDNVFLKEIHSSFPYFVTDKP